MTGFATFRHFYESLCSFDPQQQLKQGQFFCLLSPCFSKQFAISRNNLKLETCPRELLSSRYVGDYFMMLAKRVAGCCLGKNTHTNKFQLLWVFSLLAIVQKKEDEEYNAQNSSSAHTQKESTRCFLCRNIETRT